jgi:multidrug resistance efflux pump
MSTPAADPAPVPSPEAEQAARARRRRRRRIVGYVAFIVVVLLGVALVLYAWRLPPFTSTLQTTENAMVRGQVTLIAPQVSGYVTQVPVQDFQHVRAGQLLAQIDDRIYYQQLEQAQAQLQSAQANLDNWVQQKASAEASVAESRAGVASSAAQRDNARVSLRRIEALTAQQMLSRQDRDTAFATDAQARASLAQAQAALSAAEQGVRSVTVNRATLEAAVANARAAVRLARINFDNTRIVAPRAGQLGQVSVHQGAYVTNGTQLMAIVPDVLWVVANMKETQMAQVRLGQPVSFSVDALGGARLHGHVQEISPATGSEFSVLPADNATGNFVKIAQRIPVRISIDPGQQPATRLRPGMSVVVGIDTAPRR